MGERKNQVLKILVFILLQQCLQISLTLAESETTVYIVYLGEKQHEDPVITKMSHYKMLSSVLGSKAAAKSSILYSYKHGFSGFAARLTDAQAEKIADLPGVLQVFPNGISKSHTTRSWDFLGLNYPSSNNLLTQSNMGRGIIIGVIDSGVWPESKSFNDKYMDPIPPRWKGICQKGDKFNSSNCNKKIIGARYFSKGILEVIPNAGHQEYLSPRDINGHGTHTASTAAGYFVEKANYEGLLASGLARGGAPLAYLSIYKACWFAIECRATDADLLKAFDKAIQDEVDIISISIGGKIPLSSYIDQDNPISIGSFHAISKGIPVVASAGNDGPTSQTIDNTAPWMITVGASTIDRSFPTAITLGNNQILWGISTDIRKNNHGFTSLAYSERVAVNSPSVTPVNDSRTGSLNGTLVKGKIILCFSEKDTQNIISAEHAVTIAGGVGLIYAQSSSDIPGPCDMIPCIKVDFEVGTQILTYIKRASSPIVKLSLPKTAIGDLASPRVASFSSRGPNSLAPSVLKPDIIAPGVDILAAAPDSKRTDKFAFMSGTSMSCPHVSGIVALIKSAHRDWSPAAIRSALVTTASQIGKDGMHIFERGTSRKPADPFDIGGGHVNPNKAMNPGLVYDITPGEYVQFLCSLGHNIGPISRQLMTKASCKNNNHMGLNLNLPSISIPNLSKTITVTRMVTNVGHVNSEYKAEIEAPYGIKMKVEPQVLSFNMTNTILSFQVTFSAERFRGDYTFGSLTWTDGEQFVRSPIAIRAVKFGSYYEV